MKAWIKMRDEISYQSEGAYYARAVMYYTELGQNAMAINYQRRAALACAVAREFRCYELEQ